MRAFGHVSKIVSVNLDETSLIHVTKDVFDGHAHALKVVVAIFGTGTVGFGLAVTNTQGCGLLVHLSKVVAGHCRCIVVKSCSQYGRVQVT